MKRVAGVVLLVLVMFAGCKNSSMIVPPQDLGELVKTQENPVKYMAKLRGTPYEMGYQHGWLLADKVVYDCSNAFLGDIFLGLAGASGMEPLQKMIGNDKIMDALMGTVYTAGWMSFRQWVPEEYKEEIRGVFEGAYVRCEQEGWDMKQLSVDRLAMLNFWIDFMIAWIYGPVVIAEDLADLGFITGRGLGDEVLSLQDEIPEMAGDLTQARLTPEQEVELRAAFKKAWDGAHMCDGIGVRGDLSATGGTIMTRSFMIPEQFGTQSVMIECTPVEGYKFVMINPPGMIGTGSGMNEKGLSVGVDMVLTGDLQQFSIGMGCLLKNREVLQYSSTIDEAVENTFRESTHSTIGNINNDNPNGTSWLHPVADPSGVAVVEMSAHAIRVRRMEDDFTEIGQGELEGLVYMKDGAPREDLNWETIQSLENTETISQWESDPDLVIFTNHFVHPEMRAVDKHHYPIDCTGRYNFLLMGVYDFLQTGDKKVSIEEAKHLVNYLNDNEWNDEYGYAQKPLRWEKEKVQTPTHGVEGRTELFGGMRVVYDVANRRLWACYGPSDVSWNQIWQEYTF